MPESIAKINQKHVPAVPASALMTVLRVRSAALRHPDLFAPPPSHPIFRDDDGTTYSFADVPVVRADWAVAGRLRDAGLDMDAGVAAMFRARCLATVLNQGCLPDAFVTRGRDGSINSVSEWLIEAAADAPCRWTKGFQVDRLIARTNAIGEVAP